LKAEEDDETSSPFPVVLSVPINGRITSLTALPLPSHMTSLLFLTTDQYQYAVIGYNPAMAHCIQTYDSGSLKDEWNVLGSISDCGPLVAMDPHGRCIAMHLYDGLVTVFPINNNDQSPSASVLGPVFHARLEERTILQLTMLHHLDASLTPPHLCLLHQDSRGAQHISTHIIDLRKSQLWSMTSLAGNQTMAGKHVEWLKKSRIDGGSSLLIPVPPTAPVAAAAPSSASSSTTTQHPCGGVVILGQRQITYCSANHYKVMPIPPAMILSWDVLPQDVSGMPRYLLGDEFGNLHMLTLLTQNLKVIALQLDTLGSCTLSNTLQYLNHGVVFCGSTLGDSQLVQIHDEPIPVEDEYMDDDATLELGETTYLSVEEEYTHLGPIVDFDLVPMAGSNRSDGVQSQVVTASGSSKSGSLRVVQNGIGMKEYASVELSGIQNMWNLRQKFDDTQDAFLVQSFVGETRVLGVTTLEGDEDMMKEDKTEDEMMVDEEVGGTLEEVVLPGLDPSASTLFVTNVVGDLFLQITDLVIRLVKSSGEVLDYVQPANQMTVASANEAGQIAVALRGGKVLYFKIESDKIQQVATKQMDKEVSCLDINPFLNAGRSSADASVSLKDKRIQKSTFCAVGLWDDFTVRLLSLEGTELAEVLLINLSTEEEKDDEVDSNSSEKRRSNRNNMMARSLCLITLDLSSSSSNNTGGNSNTSNKDTKGPGVNMLFVGLGDGTLVSFAVVQQDSLVRVQSKKEVSLGTQRINLIPLQNERGGSCVLATGDRPTVIYLAGASSGNYNPKLCYSNVNLSPADEGDANDVSRPHAHESISVNVAASFFSPLLLDAMGQEHYSLCVADDSNLRLGVIDDIQKLHVSTYPLGMAPRRIVHCPEGRMFAVGCIESGIKQLSVGGGEMTMGNCIRFLDDTTFDDIKRYEICLFNHLSVIFDILSSTFFPH
jgi:DNA damage-binding protein 1